MILTSDGIECIVGVVTVLISVGGWLTKVAIINPLTNNIKSLTAAIETLKDVVDELKEGHNGIDKRLILVEQKIATIEHRIDKCQDSK